MATKRHRRYKKGGCIQPRPVNAAGGAYRGRDLNSSGEKKLRQRLRRAQKPPTLRANKSASEEKYPEVDACTHQYYERNATQLIARYGAASPELAKLCQRAFAQAARVLDVGAGSGRDVRELRNLGLNAEGVDASPAMVQAAVAADPALNNYLRVDALPELTSCADQGYDGVLCAAVLQHLPEDRLFDAAFALRRILKENGRLLVSIPLPDATIDQKSCRDQYGRLFTPIPPGKLQLLLERTGFTLLWREDAGDSLGREHRRWCSLLFERTNSTSRPLHTVESILNRDSKDATYKLALIRALAEIAQTQYSQATWTADNRVKIPTELIARKWLEYYWPLFASVTFIPQKYGEKADGAKRIAFRRQLSELIAMSRCAGLGKEMAEFTIAERSRRLPPPVQKAFDVTIGKLKGTVWNMPVRYAGPGEFSIFQYDPADQTVVMDAQLWREFSLTGSWIADACILRWSELTAQISKKTLVPSQIIDLLLKTPIPEHDTSAVRDALGNDTPLRCVWTDQTLREYQVDHAIPYTLWHNNDLWNLFPANPGVNNQKRDKLPTHRLVVRRKECIVNYWEKMHTAYPIRFMAEASAFCGTGRVHAKNWENPLFHALLEAIETTAVQRGIPRWEPPSRQPVTVLQQSQLQPVPETVPTIELFFIPSLKIACGQFRDHGGIDNHDRPTIRVPDPHRRLDRQRHFVAIAEGDSMIHGNNPIHDGDHILLERIDSTHAGSISSGPPVAVEYRDPITGDLCYALKKIAKTATGEYRLVSSNRAYAPIVVDKQSCFPFARLVRRIQASGSVQKDKHPGNLSNSAGG